MIKFGIVQAVRMLDEGIVQSNLYSDSDMKKAKIMAVTAMILIFAAFASLGIGAILQGDGVAEGMVVPVALVGFFGCSMIKRLFGV